jgi:hypothetical protein
MIPNGVAFTVQLMVCRLIRRRGILMVALCLRKNGATGIRNLAMDLGRSSIIRKLFRLKLTLMLAFNLSRPFSAAGQLN